MTALNEGSYCGCCARPIIGTAIWCGDCNREHIIQGGARCFLALWERTYYAQYEKECPFTEADHDCNREKGSRPIGPAGIGGGMMSFICLRCGHAWTRDEVPDTCPNRRKAHASHDFAYYQRERRMDRRFFPLCRSPSWDTPRREMRNCPGCRTRFEAGPGQRFHSKPCGDLYRRRGGLTREVR